MNTIGWWASLTPLVAIEQWMPASMLTCETAPSTWVDGFVRTVDAIRSECWTRSDQNAGRHQVRTSGRLPSEAAPHPSERRNVTGLSMAASCPSSKIGLGYRRPRNCMNINK
jgi:hypothetical protein